MYVAPPCSTGITATYVPALAGTGGVKKRTPFENAAWQIDDRSPAIVT